MAHSVGVVVVAAAPATVPPLASAKTAAAAAAAAKAASHILCAGNPSGHLEHSRRCHGQLAGDDAVNPPPSRGWQIVDGGGQSLSP